MDKPWYKKKIFLIPFGLMGLIGVVSAANINNDFILFKFYFKNN